MVLVSVKTHPVTLTLEASVETWKDGYGDLHARPVSTTIKPSKESPMSITAFKGFTPSASPES